MKSTSEIKILEDYLFADDKEAFLNTLIPGSEMHLYFRCLHTLKTKGELSVEENKDLEAFLSKNPNSSSSFNNKKIRLRALLQKYDKNPQKRNEIIEIIKSEFLKISFISDSDSSSFIQESNVAFSRSFKSEISPDEISPLKKIEDVYKKKESLQKFQPEFYHHFDIEKLIKNPDSFQIFIEKADPAEFQNFAKYLSRYIKEKLKGNSEYLPKYVYNKLDLNQMLELITLDSNIKNNQDYLVSLLIKKFRLFSFDQSNLGLDDNGYLQLLLEIYQFLKDLKIKNQSLISYILYQIAVINYFLDNINEEYFKEFLAYPLETYLGMKKKTRFSFSGSFLSSSKSIHIDDLIKKSLFHIFKTKNEYQSYSEYIQDDLLKQYFYQTKLESGENPPEIHEVFSEEKLKEICSNKELSLSNLNSQYFKSNDQVTLLLLIKNINNLTIKVFEINSESYYLNKLTEIDHNLNLDGLIAFEESNYTFKEPPSYKFQKEFKFDTITNRSRGVFIIDFIGNGICTRAIIRKGRLGVIEKQTVAGQVFQIVDEEFNICNTKDTGMWVRNHFYPADVRGEIMIPYSAERISVPTVLVHAGSAELVNIELKVEAFEFKCGYIYREESFLANTKAKVLVQPRLFLNQTPVGLGVITYSVAQIITISDTNVPTFTNYDNFKLEVDKDSELDFFISSKTARVEIKITIKIPKIGSEDFHEFNSNFTLDFALYQHQPTFYDMFLKNTSEGYFIYVLGKTGEPRKNIKLVLNINHIYYDFSNTKFNYQTNDKGFIFLGKLSEIDQITAFLEDKKIESRSWSLNKNKDFEYASKMVILENEKIELPVNINDINPHEITCYEMINENRVQSVAEFLSLNKGVLIIKN